METEAVPALLARVLKDPALLRLDFGILAQHAILTATFLGVPLVMQAAGIAAGQAWQVYLPVLVASVLAMGSMMHAGRAARAYAQASCWRQWRPWASPSSASSAHAGGVWLPAAALTLFFAAFNFLEAALPALISRFAPGQARGTAMGVYSSAQFLGIFLGGVLGGWCQGRFGLVGGFGFSLGVACLWFISAWRACRLGATGSSQPSKMNDYRDKTGPAAVLNGDTAYGTRRK